MKHSKKLIKELSDLLTMNYEVEKIYLEALSAVIRVDLKTFFRERASERNEFVRDLIKETDKLDCELDLKFNGQLDHGFYVTWMNFRRLFLEENHNGLYVEVCKLKALIIVKYNDILGYNDLPLSVFKVLENQKEKIKQTLNAIKIEQAFVA